MLQLWTISNLQRLDYSIRQKIVFYAPLTEHLDFYGVDPIAYTHTGGSITYRGGVRTVAANIPLFYFAGETPYGLFVNTGISLQFNAANGLNNANTLVWFESRVAKSTPTQTNPFDANGIWTGNLNTYVSHICKANAVLANSEITAIQAALLDTIQDIPAPPAPPPSPVGSFVMESPSGSKNGINKTFTLSQNPDLNTLIVAWGGLFLARVASGPAELQYSAGGTGNKTLTLGSAPASTDDVSAQYVAS